MAARKVTPKRKATRRPPSKKPAKKAAAVRPALSREWTLLVPLLAESLSLLKKNQFLILASGESHRFVQFAAGGREGLRAEVVSDYFLEEDAKLTARERKALASLGWQAPTHRDDAPPSAQVKGGSPNWFRDFGGRDATVKGAQAAIEVLGGVFRLTPHDVRYNAFARNGDEITLPLTGILPEEDWLSPGFRPESVEELREMVRETLQGTHLGPVRDTEGVDAVVDVGERAVFVTAHEEPMSVLVYTVVGQLDETGDAYKVVNDLNRSRAGGRAILYEGYLLVDRVLPADPFVPRQLIDAIVELVAWANAVEGGEPAAHDEAAALN